MTTSFESVAPQKANYPIHTLPASEAQPLSANADRTSGFIEAERRKHVRVLTDLIDAAYKRGNAEEARRYWRELGGFINPEAA